MYEAVEAVNGRIALADWRRTIAESYAAVRSAPEGGRIFCWQDWRATRNDLFKRHPQSPLNQEQKDDFTGLPYYDYAPDFCVEARLVSAEAPESFHVYLSTDGDFKYSRVATAHFVIRGVAAQLSLFWIEGYGGGLFLPFKDATNGRETYGGGRYLYDTIKGVDLGVGKDTILLDFNFAYNPSCAYHPRWVCPLSPRENTLPFSVAAGEMDFRRTGFR
jgi:uncharacterized protein (DUF1684 family)